MKVESVAIDGLWDDPKNPRKPDQARMALLRLSLQKLGFIQPIYARPDGMLLSGHQRTACARSLGYKTVPVVYVDIQDKDQSGFNIIANRATNDFSAFDTGHKAGSQLHYADVVEAAEELEDFQGEKWPALLSRNTKISGIGKELADRYDKKAIEMAKSLYRLGIEMPVVLSESGQVVNGVFRLLAAKEDGHKSWPVITIPDDMALVATHFLNYLSMDFNVDQEFSDILRYSAFRRPQNNRGVVPKSYRFWANGCRTLPDKDSYTLDYWRHFRQLHGQEWILDFGAGLGKVAPFLTGKGMQCIDFEPYRIDMTKDKGKVCPELSKREAKRFLDEIADGRKFSSIFLSSVLNSVPFPKDRMCVLAICHALSDKDTVIYGTCRDSSDFEYEYGGIRNANYFVFDSEPMVRVGDVMRSPKIQKFETPDTARAMFSRLWNSFDTWPGGNVFYWKAASPKGTNVAVVGQALELEFDLPYQDGSTMGLVEYAKKCFGKRLGRKIP